MIEVLPVALTTIDWKNYLKGTYQALGRSVTRSLDQKGIRPDNIAAFLGSLGEMVCEGSDPMQSVREAGSLLDHLHAAFLVVTTKDITFDLMQETRLAWTSSESYRTAFLASLVSGTFAQWRVAVLSCCSSRVTTDVRIFGNIVYQHLAKAGLEDIFAGCEKVHQDDGTIKLLERK